jgi:hypothetical protein
LGKIRANNPKASVIISQIINLQPRGSNGACPDCPQRVQALNAAIATRAHSTADSKIVVVDQFTGFPSATDTDDGMHPNTNGNTKMAAKFLNPFKEAITAKGRHA